MDLNYISLFASTIRHYNLKSMNLSHRVYAGDTKLRSWSAGGWADHCQLAVF